VLTQLPSPSLLSVLSVLSDSASGFTTRSDIGPARDDAAPTPEAAAAANAAAAAAAPSTSSTSDRKRGEDGKEGGGGGGGGDEASKRDSGDEDDAGLLGSGPYDADDVAADEIYAMVDRKMDERRKKRREEREREELERYRRERPKIQQQFADLKRDLGTVSEDEWAAIPDIGDRSIKKQKRAEKLTPVPDSVLARSQETSGYSESLDERQQKYGGFETPLPSSMIGGSASVMNLSQIGGARGAVLGVKLDQASDSVSGQTVVDPKGYLTGLDSIVLKSDAEISDINKARMLLKSVRLTNPKHAPGWIASARVEEIAGKMPAARTLIQEGCDECPKAESVWLEAARLNTPENAKVILANAVRHVSGSIQVWLKAASLESEVPNRKKVLRKALGFIPNSVRLWKAAIELEEDAEDAKVLLGRAVECVPDSVELWLALARLETYENARRVLNDARKACVGSHEVWITAAKLEEAHGNSKMIDVIVQRAVKELVGSGVKMTREQWKKEAETCERQESVGTCQAIIRATIGLDLEEADERQVWMDEAEASLAAGCVATARAIYAHALKAHPQKKQLWIQAAFLEKNHGTRASLEELLQRAVKYCPQAETLWLMGAKEKWLAGDIVGARTILEEAFRANPNNEQVWLAAVKLESENGEHERARMLLENARREANTRKVWMKSAVLERQLGNLPRARELLGEGRTRFPDFDKLWMISGQLEEDAKDLDRAREFYQQGVKQCPASVPLWILASRLEEKAGMVTKARAVLERARSKAPKESLLWLEAVQVEARADNPSMAKHLLATALQECPTSGVLWAEAIFMEPRPQRKTKSVDALKKCDNDPYVVVALARLFWAERKVDKARGWFERAVKLDPDNGDSWAYFYRFELQHGTEEQQRTLIQRVTSADPHHGAHWPRVAKAMGNVAAKPEQVLALVAQALEQPQLGQ